MRSPLKINGREEKRRPDADSDCRHPVCFAGNQTYRLLNVVLFVMFTLFGVSIAVVHAMGRGMCYARVVLGRECLFCGCTSDFFGMFRGDFSFHNPVSPWVFGLIAVEMAWRIAAAIRGGSRRVIIADAVVHLALGAVVLTANYFVLM